MNFLSIDWNVVAGKFAKAAIIGAGSALLTVNVGDYSLNSIRDYQKLAITLGVAVLAGIVHALWSAVVQMLTPVVVKPTETIQVSTQL